MKFSKKIKVLNINYKKLFRRFIKVGIGLIILYLFSLIFFYFKQEKFFFNPKILDKNYVFEFKESFKEINIEVTKNISLNSLLFKTENSKGVILYFHGNAGAIHDWGKRAHLFLNNQYDVLFVDYRGYGKSDGSYCNPDELFNDALEVYKYTKALYKEEHIIVLGFSLGSGLASYVASKNNPKMLILNAPYYSWKKLVAEEIAPPIPEFLIKYNIPTYRFLKTVTCPIKVFHGTKDFLINPKTNSARLKQLYPEKIDLIYIEDASHNSIHITKQYYDELKKHL